jgi:hypothetical protein
MLKSIEPPNEKIRILTKILKVFCFTTVIVGIFKTASQKPDISSSLYFVSGLLFWSSWRGLSYYYCLLNQVVNVSIILGLLQ